MRSKPASEKWPYCSQGLKWGLGLIPICLLLAVAAAILPAKRPRLSVTFTGRTVEDGGPIQCLLVVSNTTRAYLEAAWNLELFINGQRISDEGCCSSCCNIAPHTDLLVRLPYVKAASPWSINVYANEVVPAWRFDFARRCSVTRWVPGWMKQTISRKLEKKYYGLQYKLICEQARPGDAGNAGVQNRAVRPEANQTTAVSGLRY